MNIANIHMTIPMSKKVMIAPISPVRSPNKTIMTSMTMSAFIENGSFFHEDFFL